MILNKPSKLTDEEFEVIKKHSVIGETIIKPLGSLKDCLMPVRNHHEKLNGTGYPDGLVGEEINIETRIICVADIFDALYSDRPYRNKMSIEVIKKILREDVERGCLDERVVNVLIDMIDTEEVLSLYD